MQRASEPRVDPPGRSDRTIGRLDAATASRSRRPTLNRPARGVTARTNGRAAEEIPSRSFFALTVPGLGSFLEAEVRRTPGTRSISQGNDGRADVLIFRSSLDPSTLLSTLHAAEDLFVQVGHASIQREDRPPWLAQRLFKRHRLLDAVKTIQLRGQRRRVFRVAIRVLSERLFLRTELRRAATRVLGTLLPDWRVDENAGLEIWVIEYLPGKFVAGARLSDNVYRQRGGRRVERPGALRPAVARAMVELAGTPHGWLLDPFCGAGSILASAAAFGWQPVGSDIASDAVLAAASNVDAVPILRADARRIPIKSHSFAAIVSNLPFGKQYDLPGDAYGWLVTVLQECDRVLASRASAVFLTGSSIKSALRTTFLQATDARSIRLLGQPAVLTVCRRCR